MNCCLGNFNSTTDLSLWIFFFENFYPVGYCNFILQRALVKNEIDLDKLRSDSDGAVVEYISNAIHHCYIALSKARCRIRDNETAYDRETFVELLEDNLQYAENMDDGMFMETIRAQLTEREFLCIRLIVLEGWTAEEVSKRLGVSKQAVNQCKRRALDKVKKIYICTD